MIYQNLSSFLFLIFYGLSFLFPIAGSGEYWWHQPVLLLITLFLLVSHFGEHWCKINQKHFAFWSLLCALLGAYPPLVLTVQHSGSGLQMPGLWIYLIAHLCFTWKALSRISNIEFLRANVRQATHILTPFLFGLGLLYLWEVSTVGFAIPTVLLPAPSAIGQVFVNSLGTLWDDFFQTFIKSVLPGFVMGCFAGFIVAILVDRVPFLERGLLPFGNFISALPIVGIAPIMVMWFGFDWQSKAAVVVMMTFFPMLVNMITGLKATERIDKELIHTYHPTPIQTLLKVRLFYALPFLFNALKINSTLAVIGAIVAEFFGTPIVGMGFRISTEVGRMNIELVWATIAVSALSGSLFYGFLALIERISTFWHPSYRK